MAVARLKTWIANEILTASDLNGEFNQILNNGQDVGFPRTEAADFDGQTLVLDADADTTMRADTNDQIDIAIGGTDTYQLTATEMTILGKRVLTVDDRFKLRRDVGGLILRIGTVEARAMDLESSGLLASQLNNF